MAVVYNAQGEAKILDPVDAREHIATGRWFNESPEGIALVVEEAPTFVEPSSRKRTPGAR